MESSPGLSAVEALPPELAEFLTNPGPQTLTIRGAPGVGKTTLALTALSEFPGRRAFVTTRVPAEAMLAQYPWVRLMLSEEFQLVETVRFRGAVGGATRSVEEMHRLLQAWPSDFVDLAAVLNLPPQLVQVLRGGEGPRMVVIDSWDAWVENLIGSTAVGSEAPATRGELERSLIDQLLRTGSKVVLVVERDELARFDYLSDGNLRLALTDRDGRRERWVSVSKLRGTPIQNAEYPFTLFGARLRCMVPHLRPAEEAGAKVDPDPDPNEPTLWPGSNDFAAAFGRIPERGGVLIESDLGASASILWTVVLPMIASVIAAGGRVLVRPPIQLSARELRRSLEAIATTGQLFDQLRVAPPVPVPEDVRTEYLGGAAVASAGSLGGSGLDVALLTGPGRGDEHEELDPIRFLGGELASPAPGLVVHFLDGALVEGATGGDPFLPLPMLARQAGLPVASVVLGSSDDPLLTIARASTAVHLLVQNLRGRFFLSGRRPWTPFYALTAPEHTLGPSGPYGLLPMV